MKVHHLNCGTMRPWRTPDGLVCHVLLVETDDALVLVDSGIGLQDAADPAGRFGPARFCVRPAFDTSESAIRQVAALGYDPHEVRHIVLTHFDADHTGGLSDFPWAEVHLTATENQASLHPRGVVERGRYLPSHRAHDPRIVPHTPGRGEPWRGFPHATELADVAAGIVMISLPGHTRGHAAVAVDAGTHWVLHVGDSFYHRGQIDGTGRAPKSLTAMERLMASDRSGVRGNHRRLSRLWADDPADLLLVNSHDPVLLHRAHSRTTP
ncbi:MBL fold metallo-hydrolase [Streptomyces sp. CHD11]|uniref:MBL fold metallo-hydrolase n=1 Tax=Streptomyces sp. CHD11 TaxID=2741325 RepID=UPI001BFC9E33|nr:MBL fold metallo-hydrolase [Streptomyces sp. CHD11]MBT3150187.1 MBL fold metallo-hydrolase [Streptomyces sp. CHD11]